MFLYILMLCPCFSHSLEYHFQPFHWLTISDPLEFSSRIIFSWNRQTAHPQSNSALLTRCNLHISNIFSHKYKTRITGHKEKAGGKLIFNKFLSGYCGLLLTVHLISILNLLKRILSFVGQVVKTGAKPKFLFLMLQED